MRFYGLTLLTSAVVLGACGGEKNASTTDSAATASAATPPAPSGASTGAVGDNAAAGAAAPITGKTIEVKMLQDAQGNYKFDPADVTIKPGDGVKFVLVSGEPHNVAFDPSQVPANGKAQLSANMPTQVSELASPMMLKPNESYTISFGQIPPGKYEFHCTPHLAMGMRGSVTVQ
jgi:plastocyanin